MNKIINHLISSIDNTNPINGVHCGFVHYSGIYKNGKPLFLGSNSLRNTYNGNCICYSTHAEMDVIQKVLKGQARTTI
jgi:hypothetical protein